MGDPRFYELRDLLHNDMAAALKRIHADKSLLDVRSGLGETLLHWYAIEYREDIVKVLAELGAEIDPVNEFGSTPLLEVASINRESMCRVLLSLGASPDARNEAGETSLQVAAGMGRLGICKLLIQHGAKIDLEGFNQETALSHAAVSGQMEIVEYFLEVLGPGFDINTAFSDQDVEAIHYLGGHMATFLDQKALRHPLEE